MSMRWLRPGIVFVAAAVLVGAAFVLGGCGGSETPPTSLPAAPTAAPHQAATGPALDTALAIDQIALESPIKRTKDQNGLEFLQFKYADDDGKIYLCVLPASLATGTHKWSEWVSTFNVYKKSDVLGQKKVDKSKDNLADFPYISPKPQEAPGAGQNPRPSINVPLTPTAPSPSAGPSASPMPTGPPMAMPPPRGLRRE